MKINQLIIIYILLLGHIFMIQRKVKHLMVDEMTRYLFMNIIFLKSDHLWLHFLEIKDIYRLILRLFAG